MRAIDTAGALVVEYKYDAWGRIIGRSGSLVSTLGYLNPFRYRGYVYDEETGLYYLRSRYYNPEWGRFVNADVLLGEVGRLYSHNIFGYCWNNPVTMGDGLGMWHQWIVGAINVITGIGQMMAGAAMGATAGWTGIGAAAAVMLIANGAAETTQGVGLIANDIANDTIMYENNILRTGAEQIGGLVGGDTGETLGGLAYDATVLAAGLVYVPIKYAQGSGILRIRVPLSRVLNNPKDEFVTFGPAIGKVSEYCQSIPVSGYGKLYVVPLPNRYYMLCDGHHRVEALRKLGYEMVDVFITK